jgi:hypothetical protein
MYQSLDVLSAILTCPTAALAFTFDAQEVAKVPLEYVLPATNQKRNVKLVPLSLFNVPVVSPGNVIVLNSQVLVTFTV